MAFRKRMKKRTSKKIFNKTAKKTHRRNFIKPMRGGYRL